MTIYIKEPDARPATFAGEDLQQFMRPTDRPTVRPSSHHVSHKRRIAEKIVDPEQRFCWRDNCEKVGDFAVTCMSSTQNQFFPIISP
jgi:hypothetical protein